MRIRFTLVLLLLLGATATAAYLWSTPHEPPNDPPAIAVATPEAGDPPAEPDPASEPSSTTELSWTDRTLATLTLEQKVAQLFMEWMGGHYAGMDDPSYAAMERLAADFEIGGFIFSSSDPLSQAALINDLQARASVPLLIGQDMEWGAAMRVRRSTMFPRAMAVGASGDTTHAYTKGFVTATEARALGTHLVFAPVADVNNNPDNPVINTRAFGEDVATVTAMARAFARGVSDAGAWATGKHFPGHGDTEVDSHLALPVITHDRARLDAVELPPFQALIDADIPALMTAHIAFPRLASDPRLPATLSSTILTELLREEMGFDGLIVTDALRMEAIRQHFGAGEAAVRALEAGADILLMPDDAWAARAGVLQAVASGRLSEDRIDGSVRRVLTAKEAMGLHEGRTVDLQAARQRVGTQAHRAASHTVARDGVTLLHDDADLIPLDREAGTIVSITLNDGTNASTGRSFASALRSAAPGARVRHFLVDDRSSDPDRARALRAARQADVVVLPTYVAAQPDVRGAGLPRALRSFAGEVIGAGTPVILLSMGSPYLIRGLDARPAAYLLTYSGSAASEQAAAQALTGEAAIRGTLPVSIPDHASRGEGLYRPQLHPRPSIPEEAGMRTRALQRVDSLMHRAIRDEAFPGAAVAVGRGSALVKLDAYGHLSYDAEQSVRHTTPYDIASLTKVIVTTTALMQLYEQEMIGLDDPVATYLPDFARAGKDEITLRHLLTHTSGLPAHRPYFEEGVRTRDAMLEAIYQEPLVQAPGAAYQYSDLGFIVLGAVIETVTGQPLDAYADAEIFEPLGMHDTGYRGRGHTDRNTAPTEHDLDFRQRLIQGEVHDENAWAMGGVAGHAGVFSTARDLARFGYMLVNEGRIHNDAFLQPETLATFTTATAPDAHSRALGWDTRSAEGYSSAGQHFGPRSFGHTGFTGTSLWVDPDEALFVLLLSNRVYPTRESRGHVAVRPALADLVHSAIQGAPSLLPVTD